MELKVCKGAEQVALETGALVSRLVSGGARTIYVPAGRTPEPLYQLWEKDRPSWLASAKLIQIDDILTGQRRGQFRRFFEEALPTYKNRIEFIGGDNCTQADVALLGLGLNGHVGFHEPGLPASLFMGCVRLSPATCGLLELEQGTWGISYGLGAFMKCRAVVMMVTGKSKRGILHQLINNLGEFPALQLKDHNQFTLIADQNAMSS